MILPHDANLKPDGIFGKDIAFEPADDHFLQRVPFVVRTNRTGGDGIGPAIRVHLRFAGKRLMFHRERHCEQRLAFRSGRVLCRAPRALARSSACSVNTCNCRLV
jgi:hypothetical protein